MPGPIRQYIHESGNNFTSLVSEFGDGLLMLERWLCEWVDYRTVNLIELTDVQIQDVDGGMAWRRNKVR